LSYQKLIKRIKKNEGFSIKPYRDQLGFQTIGYGHLILSKEENLAKHKQKKTNLEKIFIKDFNNSLRDFNRFFKHYTSNKKEEELLIEMIFQMGSQRVLKFKKLLGNMRKNNKHSVCFEMMCSLWYKQTPNRVKKLIKTFLKNER
tara:strand:- start:21 stop:455 length:435 start_codon:yes stop_codon:yes gene_type:complete